MSGKAIQAAGLGDLILQVRLGTLYRRPPLLETRVRLMGRNVTVRFRYRAIPFFGSTHLYSLCQERVQSPVVVHTVVENIMLNRQTQRLCSLDPFSAHVDEKLCGRRQWMRCEYTRVSSHTHTHTNDSPLPPFATHIGGKRRSSSSGMLPNVNQGSAFLRALVRSVASLP